MTTETSNYIFYLLAYLLTTLFFLRTTLKEYHQIGSLSLFSPSIGFYFVYTLSFIIRPLFIHAGLLTSYTNDDLTHDNNYLLTSLIGVITFYLTFDRPRIIKKTIPPIPRHNNTTQKKPTPSINILLFIGATCSLTFFALIYQLGAVTSDLGLNRALFSAGTAGRGYLFFINTTAAVAILSAGYLKSYSKSPLSFKYILHVIIFIIPNLIVTNRYLITAFCTGILICYLLFYQATKKKPPTSKIILCLTFVIVSGAVLGFIRGMGQYQFDETNSSNLFVFFLWTFDMSETLSRTIINIGSFDFGLIWLEDLLYLYIPRILWESKPQIYGAIRAQAEIYPELIPETGIPIATYPIGMFGEGYFVYGAFGVIIALAITGFVLRVLFFSIKNLRQRSPYIGAILFPVFVLQCLNPLGYFRSVGWFISLVFLHTWISIIVFLLANIFHKKQVPKAQQKPIFIKTIP